MIMTGNNLPRIPTRTVELMFCRCVFDVEFTGNSAEEAELVSIKTSSGDSITGLLECMLTSIGVPALTALEQQLTNHLTDTNYFGEAETDAKERNREY